MWIVPRKVGGASLLQMTGKLISGMSVICAAAAIGCIPAAPAPAPAPHVAARPLIVGRVLRDTGEPLVAAVIDIHADSAAGKLVASAYSDARGYFFVDSVSGSVVVRVRRIGFAAQTRTVQLRSGVNEVEVRLSPISVCFCEGPPYIVTVPDDAPTAPRPLVAVHPAQPVARVAPLHRIGPRTLYVIVLDFRTANILQGYSLLMHSPDASNWGPVYADTAGKYLITQPPVGPILVEAICPGGGRTGPIAGAGSTVVLPDEATSLQVAVDPRTCSVAKH